MFIHNIKFSSLCVDNIIKMQLFSVNNIIDLTKEKILQLMPQLISQLPYYDIKHLNELRNTSERIKKSFSKLIVVGMGGAILNSKSIINFVQREENCVEIIFLHKLCVRIIEKIDISDAAFMFISNSGDTIEVLEIAQYFYKKIGNNNSFIFVYGKENSLLGNFQKEVKNSIAVEYDSKMGGRFSTFSTHNILIAMIAGIAMEKLFYGANLALNNFLDDNTEIISGALLLLYNLKQGILPIFNCSYNSEYDGFLEWYHTVLAETFGKGKTDGIVPMKLDLPLDQHGLMQAILTNKNNQIINIFEIKLNNPLEKIRNEIQKIFIEILKEASIQYRVFSFKNNDEETIGFLMIYIILETITAATFLDINPFTQPNIDNMKKELLRNYMK